MTTTQSETFDITASAGDDVLGEFQITLRYADDSSTPTSAIINGIEVADARVATILQTAIRGVASQHQ